MKIFYNIIILREAEKMFLENPHIKYLKKKYSKEKVIVFTEGVHKPFKGTKKMFKELYRTLVEDLNYDLYFFDTEEEKYLSKYGTVYRYDKSSVKLTGYQIEELIEKGCRRAFVMNTDVLDKSLLKPELRCTFLFLTTIHDIYLPEIQPKKEVNIKGADMFNIVRDVESTNLNKVCYCNKNCLKEFKDNMFKYPEKLVYFELNEKSADKPYKIIDSMLS